MSSDQQLSPRGALLMGCVFLVVGLLTIWAGLRGQASAGVPSWIPVCAGLFFMAGGGMVMINFGIAGQVGPDGQLSPNTPRVVRLANLALTLTFVGLLGAIFAWIGFGPGEREFSTTVSLPFARTPVEGNEALGRTLFGGFAVLCALVFLVGLIKGFRALGGPES